MVATNIYFYCTRERVRTLSKVDLVQNLSLHVIVSYLPSIICRPYFAELVI